MDLRDECSSRVGWNLLNITLGFKLLMRPSTGAFPDDPLPLYFFVAFCIFVDGGNTKLRTVRVVPSLCLHQSNRTFQDVI